MSEKQSDHSQGPFEGSRCLAGPGGIWRAATIRRVNEDGTFKIEFDTKDFVVMPYWDGVTASELSFHDESLWHPVFARICKDGSSFGWPDFRDALPLLGHEVELERTWDIWEHRCQQLFAPNDVLVKSLKLDQSKTYSLFLSLGLSAKRCAEKLSPTNEKPYFKYYWNQNRMGGRGPGEVKRPVTLDDAFAALGVGTKDPSAVQALQQFEEKHSVRLPNSLIKLIGCSGISAAVKDCHPNNPELVLPNEWELRTGMRDLHLSGDYAITILLPHEDEWVANFDNGEEDARIYVRCLRDGREHWLLSAQGVGMFFWDLAQTGLCWYQDTQFGEGRSVTRSDIGLVLRK